MPSACKCLVKERVRIRYFESPLEGAAWLF